MSCGGVTNSWASAVSEVLTIQAKGKTITTAPAESAAYTSSCPPRRPRARCRRRSTRAEAAVIGSASRISHPAPLQAELRQGHSQDGREQDPAHGRGVAELAVAEGVAHHFG